MKYIMALFIFISLFALKPLKLEDIEQLVPKTIEVEVKGHLLNPGLFTIDNFSKFDDLLKKLHLYKDSDYDHYALNYQLVDNEIISIKQKSDVKKISINSGDISDLITLKGIGEKIGQRIIDYRNQHGSFNKLEDLKKVKGIGEKLFQNIKYSITL